MSNDEARHQAGEGIDRRNAIKRGIGGAVAAGLVWSAPRVEGLSLRPNYASAQSDGAIGLDLALPSSSTSVASCGGGQFIFNGSRFDSEVTSYRGNFSYLAGATGTVNAVTWSVPPTSMPRTDGINFNSNFWRISSTDADSIIVHVEANCT